MPAAADPRPPPPPCAPPPGIGPPPPIGAGALILPADSLAASRIASPGDFCFGKTSPLCGTGISGVSNFRGVLGRSPFDGVVGCGGATALGCGAGELGSSFFG